MEGETDGGVIVCLDDPPQMDVGSLSHVSSKPFGLCAGGGDGTGTSVKATSGLSAEHTTGGQEPAVPVPSVMG